MIRPSLGHFYPDDMPTEERMASEWNHVLGSSHATIESSSLEEEFTRFVTIPRESRLKKLEVEALIQPITEEETKAAIEQLRREGQQGSIMTSSRIFPRS